MQSIKIWQRMTKVCNCYIIHRTSSYSLMSCIMCELWGVMHHRLCWYTSSSSSIIHQHQSSNLIQHHQTSTSRNIIIEQPCCLTQTKTNGHIFGSLLTPGHPFSMRLGGTTLRRTSRCCGGGTGQEDGVGHGIKSLLKKKLIFSYVILSGLKMLKRWFNYLFYLKMFKGFVS